MTNNLITKLLHKLKQFTMAFYASHIFRECQHESKLGLLLHSNPCQQPMAHLYLLHCEVPTT